ncbi:amidase domain-containing protein [Bacillus seohaeanensis]|uniref:Amidase domain-containing protein n=1 Tax=Bacillus seohaeanensis TaxID=284580 RepID=A0ABW5RZS9_9BACI
MRNRLIQQVERYVADYTNSDGNSEQEEKIQRKLQLFSKRQAEIVKVEAKGKINSIHNKELGKDVFYDVHYKFLIKQGTHLYMEEEVESRYALFQKNYLGQDIEISKLGEENKEILEEEVLDNVEERSNYQYDRLRAVQYAEKWWNSYNPVYKKFDVDCTNYISQCLHAGNAPMRGYPNRSKGWWMRNNNWSYSWTVANSLRWYIPSSKVGLRGKEVNSPEELKLGDVICYDFQGDGRYDHTTIVTAKDAKGMPLVNAHTTNSRMRYWNYEDSTAYTDNIKYKFFTIVDDR